MGSFLKHADTLTRGFIFETIDIGSFLNPDAQGRKPATRKALTMTSTTDHTRTFSNTDLVSYNFRGTNMRTLTAEDGTAWFVGKDATTILEYKNPSKALADHVDDEDKLNNKSLSSLGQRGGWLINESGLYSLILSSQLPAAKEFKHWVTSEVLPSTRRTGRYVPEQSNAANELSKDDVIRALTEANHELVESNAALRGALQEVTRLLSSHKRNGSKPTPHDGDKTKRTPAERWYLQQIHEHGYAVPQDCPFDDSGSAHRNMIDRFGLKTSTKRIPREGFKTKQTTRILLPTSLTPTV